MYDIVDLFSGNKIGFIFSEHVFLLNDAQTWWREEGRMKADRCFNEDMKVPDWLLWESTTCWLDRNIMKYKKKWSDLRFQKTVVRKIDGCPNWPLGMWGIKLYSHIWKRQDGGQTYCNKHSMMFLSSRLSPPLSLWKTVCHAFWDTSAREGSTLGSLSWRDAFVGHVWRRLWNGTARFQAQP